MSSFSLPVETESAGLGALEARKTLEGYETLHGCTTSPHPPLAHDQFVVRIRRLMRPLRAWWCLHFVRASAWPSDVRECFIRSALGLVGDGRDLGPEEQLRMAKMEMFAVSRGDLTPELKLMLLRDAEERWARVPHEKCSRCGLQVPTHQATAVGGAFYHERCALWKDASATR